MIILEFKVQILRLYIFCLFPYNRRQQQLYMTGRWKEVLQKNIEEFSRLQRYMRLSDKNSEAYAEMKECYIELKIILMASGINLTELDHIKE